MQSMLHTATGFEDLVSRADATLPYDFRSIFQPEGMMGKRREKARLKLLRALDGKITGLLEEGEVVKMVSHGLENSIVEQMFLGWMVYYLNLTAFVLTDRRLLLLQISSRKKPKTFIKQYHLGSIRKAKTGWGSALTVTGGDGKATAFARLPGKDGKRLAGLLQEAIRDDSTQWVKEGKQHLCPGCHVPIQGIPASCAECGQKFKSRGRAALLSLLFPGLGDIYIGHYSFAVLEMLVSGFLWVMFVSTMTDPASEQPLSMGGAFITSAILLVPFIHVPDAIATWFIAGKGLTPAGKRNDANTFAPGTWTQGS